jgi:spermidine/putrescine transport system substrate-binding protein
MYRIILAGLAVLLLGLPLLAGCGNRQKQTLELNVYNWEDYFAPTTLVDFEREYGVKVNLQTYQDEEEMLSAVQSTPGGFDVIFPSDELVSRMIRLELLAPINHKNIPNLKNIDPMFLDLSYDPVNMYSVPYTWGVTGIAVNTKYVTQPVDSWGILWDANYQGRIAMLNNSYSVIGLTLKYLGYSLVSQDPAELEQARLKLLEQKPLIVGYLDPMTCINKLVSGEIWLAMAYNGDAMSAAENNPDISVVIPKEGTDFWLDCVAIPRDSPHKETAELFINYLLRPDVQAAISNYVRYATPNRAAIEAGLITPEDLNNPAIYPPREGLESYRYPGEANPLYQSIWAELQR